MASSQSTYSMGPGEVGGVGSAAWGAGALGEIVNLEQARMLFRSSGNVILWSGLRVNIRPSILLRSSDNGKIVRRKS